jgi:hypothetical protein
MYHISAYLGNHVHVLEHYTTFFGDLGDVYCSERGILKRQICDMRSVPCKVMHVVINPAFPFNAIIESDFTHTGFSVMKKLFYGVPINTGSQNGDSNWWPPSFPMQSVVFL